MAIKTPDQLSALSSPATGDLVSLWDINEGNAEKMKRTTVSQLFASQSGTTGLAVFADETAADARTTLGVAIGTDVQAYDAGLADIAGLAVTDGNIIVGDGANWVAESGATARTSLGLGTMAVETATDYLALAGGAMTGSIETGGNHIEFSEQATPGLPAANKGRLYAEDVGGTTTLYFLDAAGLATNLTTNLPTGGGTMTGQLTIADGATSGPYGIGFSDADCGIWLEGPDAIALEAGGNLSLSVNSAGIEVLGDTDTDTLTVSGDVTLSSGFLEMGEIAEPAQAPANTGRLYVSDDGGVSNLYFMRDNGVPVDLTAAGSPPPALTNWEESGTTLQPTTAGYDLGSATNEIGDLYLDDGARVMFGIAQDVVLQRSAADVLAQVRSTTAQAMRIYNTDDGGGNAEYLELDWQTTANTCRIATAASGTGSEQDLELAGATVLVRPTDGIMDVGDAADYIRIRATASTGYVQALGVTGNLVLQGTAGTEITSISNRSVGDVNTFSMPGRNMTDADGRQAYLKLEPNINQSATAAYDAIYVDVTETATGDGTTGDGNNLLNLAVGGTSLAKIDNAGNLTCNDVNAATPIATDPVRGALYVDTTLTNTANGTPAKVLGAGSTTSITLNDVDENAVEQRLRYTGATTAWFRVSASVSCTHTVNNTILSFSFAKNGTNDANTTVNRKVGTGGDVGGVHLETVIQLQTNDYIEVFSDADNAGTTSVTAGVITMTPIF